MAIVLLGLADAAGVPEQVRQIVEPHHGFGVVLAERLLADLDRLWNQRFGLGVVPAVEQQQREVVQSHRPVRMIGSEGVLDDGDRATEQRLGPGIVAAGMQVAAGRAKQSAGARRRRHSDGTKALPHRQHVRQQHGPPRSDIDLPEPDLREGARQALDHLRERRLRLAALGEPRAHGGLHQAVNGERRLVAFEVRVLDQRRRG